jgi:hypothetical protein
LRVLHTYWPQLGVLANNSCSFCKSSCCFNADEEIIENLDNLPELQSIQLQANQIKKLNKSLNTLKKLEYLRLDQNEIENISTSEIASCLNLIYLNISHNSKIDSLLVNMIKIYFKSVIIISIIQYLVY